MLDLNLSDLARFTDEEIYMLEEMAEMLDEMTAEEIQDFLNMIEVMGKKKREKVFLSSDTSEYYH